MEKSQGRNLEFKIQEQLISFDNSPISCEHVAASPASKQKVQKVYLHTYDFVKIIKNL